MLIENRTAHKHLEAQGQSEYIQWAIRSYITGVMQRDHRPEFKAKAPQMSIYVQLVNTFTVARTVKGVVCL